MLSLLFLLLLSLASSPRAHTLFNVVDVVVFVVVDGIIVVIVSVFIGILTKGPHPCNISLCPKMLMLLLLLLLLMSLFLFLLLSWFSLLLASSERDSTKARNL